MALKCVLGLVACLTYNGTAVTAQQAVATLDGCTTVIERHTRPNDAMLEVIADSLAAVGARIQWPRGSNSGTKRALLVRECATYQRAFNTDSQWSNLDKWPY